MPPASLRRRRSDRATVRTVSALNGSAPPSQSSSVGAVAARTSSSTLSTTASRRPIVAPNASKRRRENPRFVPAIVSAAVLSPYGSVVGRSYAGATCHSPFSATMERFFAWRSPLPVSQAKQNWR